MANRTGRYLESRDVALATVSRLEQKIAEARSTSGSCCSGVWNDMMPSAGATMLTRFAQVARLCLPCQLHLLMTLADPTDVATAGSEAESA